MLKAKAKEEVAFWESKAGWRVVVISNFKEGAYFWYYSWARAKDGGDEDIWEIVVD